MQNVLCMSLSGCQSRLVMFDERTRSRDMHSHWTRLSPACIAATIQMDVRRSQPGHIGQSLVTGPRQPPLHNKNKPPTTKTPLRRTPLHPRTQPGLKSWGDQGLGSNTGALAPRARLKAGLGVGCGRGSPPPAVSVRGYYSRKIFENSDAESCILVTTCCEMSCFLKTTAKKLGDQYILSLPRFLRIVAPMLHSDKTPLCQKNICLIELMGF